MLCCFARNRAAARVLVVVTVWGPPALERPSCRRMWKDSGLRLVPAKSGSSVAPQRACEGFPFPRPRCAAMRLTVDGVDGGHPGPKQCCFSTLLFLCLCLLVQTRDLQCIFRALVSLKGLGASVANELGSDPTYDICTFLEAHRPVFTGIGESLCSTFLMALRPCNHISSTSSMEWNNTQVNPKGGDPGAYRIM